MAVLNFVLLIAHLLAKLPIELGHYVIASMTEKGLDQASIALLKAMLFRFGRSR